MEPILQPLLQGLTERATYLVPVLVAAFILGEPLAKLLRFPELRARIGTRIAQLNKKLNRQKRSSATRVYRGIVALVMLLVPALALGLVLMRPEPWVQLIAALLLVALFGTLLRPYQLLRLRREAKAGRITLQSTEPPFLFPDTHALIRYSILTAAERVALLIGGSLYFLIASVPGLLVYFMLAAAARFYAPVHTGNRAFGWAASALYALIDAPPRFLTALFCWIASLFTPRTAPFAPLRHFATATTHFHGWVAYLLGLSLGGPIPTEAGETTLPWLGTGTPRPDATHLSRTLQLMGLASLLWIWVLGASVYLFSFVK